jgi:MFS family permease
MTVRAIMGEAYSKRIHPMPQPDPMPHASLAPSSRAARIAVGALFFINGFAFATWVSRIPAVQTALGLTPGTLGAALMGLGAGSFVAMPIAGWLIARTGSRRVVMATTLACAALVLLPAFAGNAVALGAALALFGAAMGAMDVAMNAQGVELEHHVGRPILSGFHALFSLGGMSGAALGGAIAAGGVPVAVHFGIVAALLVGVAAAVLPSLIEAPPAPADDPGGRLRLSPALVGLSVLAACFFVSEGAMADWTPVYLSSVLGTGPGVAAAGYAVFSAAMTIGRLSGDWLTVRIGRTRIVRMGALLAAAGLSAALLIGTVPAALVGFVCVGAGFSVAVPLVFSAAGRLDSRSAGPGLAAVTTAGYLGFLAGPPVLGFVAEAFTLPIALTLIVCLALLGAALAGFVSVGDSRS